MAFAPSVSRELGVALEETGRSAFGARYVLVDIDDNGDLVKSTAQSAHTRTNDWRIDLKNVQKHFGKEPALAVFFAPRKPVVTSPQDREVFVGHGFKKGGLPEFLTDSARGSPSAARINTKWKKHSNRVSQAQSAEPRAILIAHIPDGASSEAKSRYNTAKGVLKSHLGSAEVHSSADTISIGGRGGGGGGVSYGSPRPYQANGRGGVDYGSSGHPHRRARTSFDLPVHRSANHVRNPDRHISKLKTATGPLNLWEQAAIQSEQDAQQIQRETPKMGGFLAQMHEAGGLMGVPVADDIDVVKELKTNVHGRSVSMAPPNARMNVLNIVKEADKAQPDWAKTADKMVAAHRKSSAGSSSGGSTGRSSSSSNSGALAPPVSPYVAESSSASSQPTKKKISFDLPAESPVPPKPAAAAAPAPKPTRTPAKNPSKIIAPKQVNASSGKAVVTPARKPATRSRTPIAPMAGKDRAAPSPKTANKVEPPKAGTKAASPVSSFPKPKKATTVNDMSLEEWLYKIDIPTAAGIFEKAGCKTLLDVKNHDFTEEELEAQGMANEARRFQLLYLIEKLKK